MRRGGKQRGRRAQGVRGANSSTARFRSYEPGTGQNHQRRAISSFILINNACQESRRAGADSRYHEPVETIPAPTAVEPHTLYVFPRPLLCPESHSIKKILLGSQPNVINRDPLTTNGHATNYTRRDDPPRGDAWRINRGRGGEIS